MMPTNAESPRRPTPEEWQQLITEQQAGWMSQRSFCREKGLVLSTFRNWKRRLAETAPASPTAEADWLELPADLTRPADAPQWDIELDLGNGLRLRLRQR